MLLAVKLLLVRTPNIGTLHLMYSLSAAAHPCNCPITVCIGQAAAYLKTCEANGAAPSNAAVALINLCQLLIGWREVQI